jgi:hypothetical protein
VVVNPTDWDATVELGRLHRDVSSGQVDRRFVVPRLDGRIYLPGDGTIEPGSLPSAEPQLTTAGPAGVVERDGNLVVRDGHGMAILIGREGTIESLCAGGQELLDSVAPVIVSDDKWRNFDTEDLQHEVSPDGTVMVTGKRTFGTQVLEFTHTMRLADGRLVLDYHWRARTPLQLRAFRQSVRFSPRLFGGKVMSTGTDPVPLPQAVADDPNLAKAVTSATLPIDDVQSITVRLPQAGHLVDDRYYNGPGYLLAFYPIAGEVLRDRQWSYSVEIVLNHGQSSRSESTNCRVD